MEIGTKVYVISHEDESAVHVYGAGVYDGDQPIGPEARGHMVDFLRSSGKTNPQITLDTGERAWGCEVWFGPHDEVLAKLAAKAAAGKPTCTTHSITETRVNYDREHRKGQLIDEVVKDSVVKFEKEVKSAIDGLVASATSEGDVRTASLMLAFYSVASKEENDGNDKVYAREVSKILHPYFASATEERREALVAAGVDVEELLAEHAGMASEDPSGEHPLVAVIRSSP